MQCHQRDSDDHVIALNTNFRSCPLCTKMSTSLNLLILCSVDGGILKGEEHKERFYFQGFVSFFLRNSRFQNRLP